MKKQKSPVCTICPPPFIKMFMTGLLLGAAVIWFFWRQRNQTRQVPAHRTEPSHGSEIDITYAARLHPDTTPLTKESPTVESPAKPAPVKVQTDFTLIKGIGPVYAQRLQAAGILTFADLAKQSPQHLRAVVQAKEWQALDIEGWVDQARQLAS